MTFVHALGLGAENEFLVVSMFNFLFCCLEAMFLLLLFFSGKNYINQNLSVAVTTCKTQLQISVRTYLCIALGAQPHVKSEGGLKILISHDVQLLQRLVLNHCEILEISHRTLFHTLD